MQELFVDPEFAQLLSPLTDEEHEELVAELKAHGCLSPIIVWKGKEIILDGHNRYEICTKNRIPFKVREMEFLDRDEVKTWIISNQLARRNISTYRKYELLEERRDIKEKRENAAKTRLANLKGHEVPDLPTNGNSIKPEQINMQSELSKELGVSKGTISKNADHFEEAHGKKSESGNHGNIEEGRNHSEQSLQRHQKDRRLWCPRRQQHKWQRQQISGTFQGNYR